MNCAGQQTTGARPCLASSLIFERSASSTPMCSTKAFEETAISASPALLRPLREMKRTKQARETFKDNSASLAAPGRAVEMSQSVISHEWAVKLQGMPETSLATSARVAVVAAQWAWI